MIIPLLHCVFYYFFDPVTKSQMLGHLDSHTVADISYSTKLQTEPTDRSGLLGSYAAFK